MKVLQSKFISKPKVSYVGLPFELIEDKSLSFSDKSILNLCYGIEINGFVKIDNLAKRWKKSGKCYDKIPQKLRERLVWLEANGYLKRIWNGIKIAGVKILYDKYASSQVFLVKKTHFSNFNLCMSSLLIVSYFGSLPDKFYKFESECASKLGVCLKTIRKYIHSPYLSEILISKKNEYRQKVFLSYKMSTRYKLCSYAKCTLQTFTARRFNYSTGYQHALKRPVDDRATFFHTNRENRFIYNIYNKINNNGQNFMNQEFNLADTGNYSNARRNLIVLGVRKKLQKLGIDQTLEAINVKWMKMEDKPNLSKISFTNDSQLIAFLARKMRPANQIGWLTSADITEEMMEVCLEACERDTEKRYSQAYLRWKLKRLSPDVKWKTSANAKAYILAMLKNDEREPLLTKDWDVEYDPDRCNAEEHKLKRGVKLISINEHPVYKVKNVLQNIKSSIVQWGEILNNPHHQDGEGTKE